TITSTYSKKLLTLILPHHVRKSLAIKAFSYTFRSKVSRLLPAEQHTRRDAYLGVPRSCGPWKQLAQK
ncbi:hypothetical protein, partial [Streptococcus suis]|uniref:hypothetical protein n=1 Tax=Streptococcus suis TaxID=1307 RepID=UPI003703BC68